VLQPVGGAGDAEQVVRALSAQEVDAFVRRDRQRLASLWSEVFVVTNPLNRPDEPVAETVPGTAGFDLRVLRSLTFREADTNGRLLPR
jgi:hypothetical protein